MHPRAGLKTVTPFPPFDFFPYIPVLKITKAISTVPCITALQRNKLWPVLVNDV